MLEITRVATAEDLATYSLNGEITVDQLERIEDSALVLPDPHRGGTKAWIAPETGKSGDLRAGIRALEIQLIESALQESHGQVAGRDGAASRLGIPPATLDNKIRIYRIDKSRFAPKP